MKSLPSKTTPSTRGRHHTLLKSALLDRQTTANARPAGWNPKITYYAAVMGKGKGEEGKFFHF